MQGLANMPNIKAILEMAAARRGRGALRIFFAGVLGGASGLATAGDRGMTTRQEKLL